ncbi:AAA family ATPase [Spirosoma litoris]
MEKQHLTYFKIENFKRFDSFEMSNLGQFNLIVGDNNVGKTSVLEALTFDEDSHQMVFNLLMALSERKLFTRGFVMSDDGYFPSFKKANIWQFLFKKENLPIKITFSTNIQSTLSFELRSANHLSIDEVAYIENTQNLLLRSFKNFIKITKNNDAFDLVGPYLEDVDIDSEIRYPFVSNGVELPNLMNRLFYEYVNDDRHARKDMIDFLRTFFPNLEEIKTHRFGNSDEVLGIVVSDKDGILPISHLGDGTAKIIKLFLRILDVKCHRLLVDEIGSGIHFTRLKEYWKTIIQLCAKYKVQFFATTHSLECQQAFVEALEDPEMQQYQKEARNISLLENKHGEVESVTFDFEQFEYALNIGFNTRGGKA